MTAKRQGAPGEGSEESSRGVLVLAMLSVAAACGGTKTNPDAPSASTLDAGTAVVDHAPEPRPFANSPIEAQTMMQSQIDRRMKTLWKCVEDLRARKGDPHRAVVVDVGIDQEGALLGVTSANPKHELDPTLKECMFSALHGSPFPRSHAGVITLRQTFQDTAVVQ